MRNNESRKREKKEKKKKRTSVKEGSTSSSNSWHLHGKTFFFAVSQRIEPKASLVFNTATLPWDLWFNPRLQEFIQILA